MSVLAGAAPPYLPSDLHMASVQVDDRWSAVSVPSLWGRQAVSVLGDRSGPVLEDPVVLHVAWPLPPGGADDWPDAADVGVTRYGPGDWLTVPGLREHVSGTRWLRTPTLAGPAFTEPTVLRAALECVVGPLAEVAGRGPVVVCRYCDTPTRDAQLVAWQEQLSGPGYSTYACSACWPGAPRRRHLRLVKESPR